MKTVILFVSTIFISIFHADGLAEYYYYTDDQGHIVLKLELDQHELKQYIIDMDCKNTALKDLCITNYLEAHSYFKINEEKVDFEFESSSIYNDHIILNYTSNKVFRIINNVEIKNTSFFEINAKFKNRIRLNINQYQKSFLLTKGQDFVVLK